MGWKLQLPKFLFGGVVTVAVTIAGFGFVTFSQNIDAMREASQENISWSAAQLEKELMRFRDSLRASDAGLTTSSADINQRFDVLWSRIAIFQRGKVGDRLREYDLEINTIGRLFEEMKAMESLVVSISSYDFATMSKIHQAFYPFSGELSELSRRVTVGEEQKAAVFRAHMREAANFALYASISTVLLVMMAMGYFVLDGQRFRKLAEQNMVLAERFKQASLVKSRFLTMMSHELRTPMNGVLGLLAVARQSNMTPSQRKILTQVDRSSNRMLGMLTDILDFAALDNAQFGLDNKPFFSQDLISALPDLLGPVADQAKAKFKVEVVGEVPTRLCGDATRLRRSYALLVTYFLETAGAREIELRISYEDNHLIGRIVVDYLDGGWSPDLISGEREESADSFASEVLGPAVARALVDKMSGEIRHGKTEDGKIVLTIDVPVQAQKERNLKVLLNMQSAPMEMVFKSAVSDFHIDYLSQNDSSCAEIVMMESGMANEEERVSNARKNCPEALVFGIGRSYLPALYDFVAEIPLEVDSLKNKISEVLG